MSVTRHARGRGCTIRCSSRCCPSAITTAQATKKAIRGYAKAIGWARREGKDVCATCIEPAIRAGAARRAERDRRRRMTPEQRREDDNRKARERRAAKRQAKEVA